jgi:hypothetical protein
MATQITDARRWPVPDADRRGYHVVYHEHETNHCPGCGRSHWYVGRVMAECAFCATALPLETSALIAGGQTVRINRRRPLADEEQAFAA